MTRVRIFAELPDGFSNDSCKTSLHHSQECTYIGKLRTRNSLRKADTYDMFYKLEW